MNSEENPVDILEARERIAKQDSAKASVTAKQERAALEETKCVAGWTGAWTTIHFENIDRLLALYIDVENGEFYIGISGYPAKPLEKNRLLELSFTEATELFESAQEHRERLAVNREFIDKRTN